MDALLMRLIMRQTHHYAMNTSMLDAEAYQPAPILHNEGIVAMDRLNRRRARQSRSAEVRIEFTMLSSQCKAAREWETSTYYTRKFGGRASTCDRHINNNMTVRSHEA
jgi:hypothetical protein